MKCIEYFEKSNHKLNWGEVYYALKKGFLTPQFVLDLFNKNSVTLYSVERYVELLSKLEHSVFDVLSSIKRFILEDDFIKIEFSDSDIIESIDYSFLPIDYKVFWDSIYEYSLIYEIVHSDLSILEKFYKLYLNHSEVNYKFEWKKFINYYFNGVPNIDELSIYNDFIIYFEELEKKLNLDKY